MTTWAKERGKATDRGRRRFVWGTVGLVLMVALFPGRAQQRRPALVVYLVVDQMRADYIDRYQHQWRGGLRQIVDRGAWFRQANYPYFLTVTCAGHATLGSGTLPSTHGMAANYWWDRETQRRIGCADDPKSPFVSHAAPLKGGASPHRLLVPTLADEMRVQLSTVPRIVVLSGKPRSAMMLAGRRADVLVWFDAMAGGWVTSTFYTPAPYPFIQQIVARDPIDRDFGRVWTRAMPESGYLYKDSPTGRTPHPGVGPLFPHPLKGDSETPGRLFYESWEDSPFINDALGRMASAALDAFDLGQGDRTDFLAVSFSGIDRVGHTFGPFSHELQDALFRLDVSVGTLIADLDRLVGRDRYVLALSSDHGVAPIPEQILEEGFDAGRIVTRDLTRRLNAALQPILGEGRHVVTIEHSQVYFADGLYSRLRREPAAMQVVLDLLMATPGVLRVLQGEEVAGAVNSPDPLIRSIALGYVPGRSGEMIMVPKPYWSTSEEAATHGTAYTYDKHVPVLLMGAGVRPGEYLEPITPADIAPTLAFLTGVTLSRTDGRVLHEAIVLPGLTAPIRPSADNRQAPTRP